LKFSPLLALPLALLAAACGSSGSSSSAASSTSTSTSASASTSTAPAGGGGSVALGTRSLPGVGTVLVNGQGRTLYTFAPDRDSRVTCVGACASVWPPLKISAGRRPSLGAGVRAALVGSDPDPAGGRVVTYAGWPLYLYTADSGPGSDLGQNLNSSGGVWHVISPAGRVITSSAGSGGGSSGSSGYGSGSSGYGSGGSGY